MSETGKLTPREERGLIIAALCKLEQRNGIWLVPSQSLAEKRYIVNLEKHTCSCPDHQETGVKCKHQLAVEFTIKRELAADGTVSETRSITFAEKITYTQDWTAYNDAQTNEKDRFQVLLADLCSGIKTPPRPVGKPGRNRVPLSDVVFGSVYKIYSTFSSRRFSCDLRDAHDKGYLSRPCHYNSINHYLESKELTPILQRLIVQSSLPLRTIETTFAPDSTGFSVSRHVRWFDEKYGVQRSGRDWVKAHAVCGCTTHIVTAVEIFERYTNDAPILKPLIETTAQNFTVKEVAADKGYISKNNLAVIESVGGAAYIPFKDNAIPGEAGSLWEKMFHYYQFKRDDFLAHYHQRSNIESVFSAVKRKFGDHVRSRSDVAMKNEVLAKFLCHNIVTVIHSQSELGIEATFWPEESTSPAVLTMKRR